MRNVRLFFAFPARRLSWLAAAVVLAFLFVVWRGCSGSNPDAAQIGRRAQEELERTASYRFRLTVRTVIDGQEAVVSNVEGKFVRPDSFYLCGQSYDYRLELYQFGRRVYFKDPADNVWKEAQGGPNLVTEAVSVSTSPLADFLQAAAFELVGQERWSGTPCYHLKAFLPEVANSYWRVFFTDFSLEAWVSRSTLKLIRLKLVGTNRTVAGDQLEIEAELFDHDAPLHIVPPPELKTGA